MPRHIKLKYFLFMKLLAEADRDFILHEGLTVKATLMFTNRDIS